MIHAVVRACHRGVARAGLALLALCLVAVSAPDTFAQSGGAQNRFPAMGPETATCDVPCIDTKLAQDIHDGALDTGWVRMA